MNQDEIIEMAKQAQVHEELCGEHFIYEVAKLVAAKEREACVDIADNLARSPAEFATMAEYKVYKLGVMLYSNAIRARGEA